MYFVDQLIPVGTVSFVSSFSGGTIDTPPGSYLIRFKGLHNSPNSGQKVQDLITGAGRGITAVADGVINVITDTVDSQIRTTSFPLRITSYISSGTGMYKGKASNLGEIEIFGLLYIIKYA